MSKNTVNLPLIDLVVNKIEFTGFNPNFTIEIKFSFLNMPL